MTGSRGSSRRPSVDSKESYNPFTDYDSRQQRRSAVVSPFDGQAQTRNSTPIPVSPVSSGQSSPSGYRPRTVPSSTNQQAGTGHTASSAGPAYSQYSQSRDGEAWWRTRGSQPGDPGPHIPRARQLSTVAGGSAANSPHSAASGQSAKANETRQTDAQPASSGKRSLDKLKFWKKKGGRGGSEATPRAPSHGGKANTWDDPGPQAFF